MYTITVYSKNGRSLKYKSNVLPMVGDMYSPLSLPDKLNPDGDVMVIESRQLNTTNGCEDMVIVNIIPKKY